MSVDSTELGWPTYQVSSVERWRQGERHLEDDWVAEEAPVALVYNGEPHVVMLATPLDLEDFAIGFSLTEGIVATADEVESARVFQRSEGIEVRLRVPAERCNVATENSRNLTGRTGCGLCGAQTLAQAIRPPRLVSSRFTVAADELQATQSELRQRQKLNERTGAVHAAAWVLPGKGVQLVREDVGRHNALDKLLGALARTATDFATGYVVVTSRASYEMVQKCTAVGVSFMVAISAPTGLAVRMARASGLTLVGFARGDSWVVYSQPGRISCSLDAGPSVATSADVLVNNE